MSRVGSCWLGVFASGTISIAGAVMVTELEFKLPENGVVLPVG